MLKWGTFYLLIAEYFKPKNIGGAKELVVLLWLSGDILYKQWTKRVGLPFMKLLKTSFCNFKIILIIHIKEIIYGWQISNVNFNF